MLISKVIKKARSGELGNLSETKFDDDKVMEYIEDGLIALYKLFSLRSAEALITMRTGVTMYTLDGTDPNVDMDDTALEVMAIQEAYDETGAYLSINVENDEWGLMTPEFNKLQIPSPAEGETIGVLYTAGPEEITSTTQTLKLPISLLESLLHYVGYRAHGSVDGNIQAENNTHLQRFRASVAEAKALGVITQDDIGDRPTSWKGYP